MAYTDIVERKTKVFLFACVFFLSWALSMGRLFKEVGLQSMREFAKQFYNSKEWHTARELYLKKKGRLCERCLSLGKYTAADTVHHIIHLNARNIKDEKIALGEDNLMALCKDCHNIIHERKRKKRFQIRQDGTVSPLLK